jgi:two-component system chemotaxis response regulator CheY
VRRIISGILVELGFDVSEASDGAEGLARIRDTPDLAVTIVDWNMPVLDGLGLVRAVRSDPNRSSLPILMVTTETEKERIVKALIEGADEYLMKPFTREMIVEKLALLDLVDETV